LEVRLGGIYALERIARDSPTDHWTIIEVLSTYVRENSPARNYAFNLATGPWGWRRARSAMDTIQTIEAIDVEIQRLQAAKALLLEGSPTRQTSSKAVT
jgi:hypothetical protein